MTSKWDDFEVAVWKTEKLELDCAPDRPQRTLRPRGHRRRIEPPQLKPLRRHQRPGPEHAASIIDAVDTEHQLAGGVFGGGPQRLKIAPLGHHDWPDARPLDHAVVSSRCSPTV
jgi:hypothetical protein